MKWWQWVGTASWLLLAAYHIAASLGLVMANPIEHWFFAVCCLLLATGVAGREGAEI